MSNGSAGNWVLTINTRKVDEISIISSGKPELVVTQSCNMIKFYGELRSESYLVIDDDIYGFGWAPQIKPEA